MSGTSETNGGGGMHVGNAGGSMILSVGGDMTGRDETTTTTTTMTITKGFAAEDKKQQFQTDIDQLREALRAMKTEIEAHPALSADEKEEITAEILQHVTALKDVKEKTAAVPVGKQAPADVA